MASSSTPSPTSSTHPPSPSQIFRLLELPGELRSRILAFTVSETNVIRPRVVIPQDAYQLNLPAITRASRQLRNESLPLYYEENTFLFQPMDVLEKPLKQDIRYEKKLLTFGAWSEAAGDDNFVHIRNFGFSSGPHLYVFVRILNHGKLELRVDPSILQSTKTGKPVLFDGCRKTTHEEGEVMRLLYRAVERNGNRGLYPEDLKGVCQAILDHPEEMLRDVAKLCLPEYRVMNT